MWSWHVLAPTVSDGAIRPLGPLTSKRQGRVRLTPVRGPFQAAAYAREGRRLRVLEYALITAWSAASFVGFFYFFRLHAHKLQGTATCVPFARTHAKSPSLGTH